MGRNRILAILALLTVAVGSSLLFVYINGADDRANEKFDAVQVLRVVKTINPGETIEEAQRQQKIQLTDVPKTALAEGALEDTSGLNGKVALTTLYPGELLIAERFGAAQETEVLTIPEGQIAISVNLSDPARVAGFVNPGAEVAIFAKNSNGSGPFVRMLLPRVQVIGVGATTAIPTTVTDEEGASTTETLPRTLLTLALDKGDAEKVLLAAGTGELAFGLLTPESDTPPGEGANLENLFETN